MSLRGERETREMTEINQTRNQKRERARERNNAVRRPVACYYQNAECVKFQSASTTCVLHLILLNVGLYGPKAVY